MAISASQVKELREQVVSLEQMTSDELYEFSEQQDDGILNTLIEDSFYDYPDFLNEEW